MTLKTIEAKEGLVVDVMSGFFDGAESTDEPFAFLKKDLVPKPLTKGQFAGLDWGGTFYTGGNPGPRSPEGKGDWYAHSASEGATRAATLPTWGH